MASRLTFRCSRVSSQTSLRPPTSMPPVTDSCGEKMNSIASPKSLAKLASSIMPRPPSATG